MLDTVSCWYVDWANLGAWTGGIGSAAAAIVAVWIARRDSSRRRTYAQFLFERDVEKLRLLEISLQQSADAMEDLEIHRDEHPDETAAKLIRDHGFSALSKLPLELEFFGRSDMLFEYNPATENFTKLQNAIRQVQGIPDLVNITLDRFDGVAAADEMRRVTDQFAQALAPFSRSTP